MLPRIALRALPSPAIPTVALALLCGLLATAPAPIVAEPASGVEQRRDELRRLEQQLLDNRHDQARLAETLEALRLESERYRARLVAVSARVREGELALTASRERLRQIERQESGLRRSLEARRETMVEVLAALQRLGRRPPPAVIVQPEDMLAAIRASMLLSGVVPDLSREAKTLMADLSDLVRLRRERREEVATGETLLAALTAERQALDRLIEERGVGIALGERQLQEERRRATELARQTRTLKELITRMEAEMAAAARAAAAAQGAPQPTQDPARLASLPGGLRDALRLQPRIPFADQRGQLTPPVHGVAFRSFGAPDGFGSHERGMTFRTETEALVIAPADGWVVFAGPYRAYGHVLILNLGGGYHLVMTGMETTSVSAGIFVLAGEPVARMGARAAGAVRLGDDGDAPMLYVELRKDGAPVDPAPWWVPANTGAGTGDRPRDSEQRKARG